MNHELRELCSIVGIVRGDDGPLPSEYAAGDAKTGVLLTIAAKEKAEADLAALREQHDSDVLDAARKAANIKQEIIDRLHADLTAALADSRALRAVLREVLGIWRSESGCECVSCAALHARATALAASPCDAKAECEGCKRLRTALEVREALIAKLRELTPEHRSWVGLMDGTPAGTVPMTVYRTKRGQVIVCGDPSDAPDDEDECRHNCDAMGCTTFSHVLWRGSVESFEAMCETAASAMLDDAAITAPKGGEVETHEARWRSLGWDVKWCDDVRAYHVHPVGKSVPNFWCLTVQAADAWIADQAAKGGGR